MAEWIEAAVALATILAGFALLVMPGVFFRNREDRSSNRTVPAIRSHLAGLLLGLGLSAFLLQQPLIYLALGVSWAGSAIGQIVSILVERQLSPANFIVLIIKLMLAALPISAVLGVFG